MQILEGRAWFEAGASLALMPLWQLAPRGDGHPVLVLPGLVASDRSTAIMRRFLGRLGYAVSPWGLGINFGPRPGVVEGMRRKIEQLAEAHGRKVSLVGWSLGGLFALYGAHQASECVRSVITLGSPVSVDPEGSNSPGFVKALYRVIAHPIGPATHVMQPRAKKLREMKQLPVPMSCLYSISDGVVPAQEATIDGDPAMHENIRVFGSHSGLGFNGMVMCIIADRLSQPEREWQPFKPSGLSGAAYRMMTHEAVPF